MRIVTDSSANIVDYKDMNLGVAPLHIIVGDMDYVDDDMVDIDAMQKKLSSYKGKTSTASPSPEEWERAFGNDDIIFCITITSGLSGTYNSALAAKDTIDAVFLSIDIFETEDYSKLDEIELLENNVDNYEKELIHNHVERLMNSNCDALSGIIFSDIVTDLERCSDHAINLAYALKERNN